MIRTAEGFSISMQHNTRVWFALRVTFLCKCSDLMLMLCLNATMDWLPVASSLHWYGDVLIREVCHIY